MILSIDCGSTNFKAALFAEGRRVADASLPVPYQVYDHQSVEMDPEAIWELLVALITRACDAAGVTAERIKTIAFTSQAQTFTVLDVAGKPLLPVIGWADKRAEGEAAELVERCPDIHAHTSFWTLFPQSTASKLLWAARRDPKLLVPEHRVVLLPSFLADRLAGVRAIDPNQAAMCGLYSMVDRDWWKAALDAVGVRPSQLPAIVPMGQPTPATRITDRLKLAPDVRVVMACNDQTSGAMGSGVGPRGAIITLGTALVAYRHAGDQPGPFHAHGCWGPYPAGGFYELATRDEGCATLDWADRLMHGRVDSPRFVQLASRAAVRDDMTMFFPSRWNTPQAWSDASASPADKAWAVLEGISFSVRQLVCDDLAIDPSATDLAVIGGGSRLDAWLQMLANVLNAPVRRGQGDTLLGAARIAGAEITTDAGSLAAIFQPQPDRVRFHQQRFNRWRTP